MSLMDDTDRMILNRIQSDFPIDPRPFQVIATELGLVEEDVIERVGRLKENGIIRRIGGNFIPRKLGYVSTLCAACVPEDRIESFKKIVNEFSGVTHNYRRDNHFNIWFTFIGPSMEEIEANIKKIARESGVDEILNLPATKTFKIKAHFDL